ncbi:hypothetical protein VTK56DRAFT_451 [Thermocarpiscus australiensis]
MASTSGRNPSQNLRAPLHYSRSSRTPDSLPSSDNNTDAHVYLQAAVPGSNGRWRARSSRNSAADGMTGVVGTTFPSSDGKLLHPLWNGVSKAVAVSRDGLTFPRLSVWF